MAHFAGLVAAGEHPNPVEHADVVTTTIHKTLGGPRSGMILCREELAKDIDRSVFPGPAGRPADARDRRQGGRARDREHRAVPGPPAPDDRQRHRRLPRGCRRAAIDVLTGGTDVHLVLVDLTSTGLDGKTAEDRLEEVGITVNRNAIPFDERPPMNPSGLRIGTPALTTRGLGEDEMREIAAVIAVALSDRFEAERDVALGAQRGADGALSALPAALSAALPRSERRLR